MEFSQSINTAGCACLCDQACRALVAGGANVMCRNNKNRIPGNQLKVRHPLMRRAADVGTFNQPLHKHISYASTGGMFA
jgi:hypothetical protein